MKHLAQRHQTHGALLQRLLRYINLVIVLGRFADSYAMLGEGRASKPAEGKVGSRSGKGQGADHEWNVGRRE